VQALVTENKYGVGRRTTQGVDSNRVAMLVAVLEKYFELPFSFCDIYINVVGGIKLEGREGDLAIISALLSSYDKKPLPEKMVYIGEVGLTGEVRPVPQVERRVKEVFKLGYTSVCLSKKNLDKLKAIIEESKKSDHPLEVVSLEKIADLKHKA
jgi:DNA repair protein RadA/Sms